jgi:hypothetical protein
MVDTLLVIARVVVDGTLVSEHRCVVVPGIHVVSNLNDRKRRA